MCAHLMLVFHAQKSLTSTVAVRRGNITCSLRMLTEVSQYKQSKIQYTEIPTKWFGATVHTSSDAERRHCTAACFFISSRLRSVPPFFLLLPHFFPVPFSQPKKMSFSFQFQNLQSVIECKISNKSLKLKKDEISCGGTLPGPAGRNRNCHAEEG